VILLIINLFINDSVIQTFGYLKNVDFISSYSNISSLNIDNNKGFINLKIINCCY